MKTKNNHVRKQQTRLSARRKPNSIIYVGLTLTDKLDHETEKICPRTVTFPAIIINNRDLRHVQCVFYFPLHLSQNASTEFFSVAEVMRSNQVGKLPTFARCFCRKAVRYASRFPHHTKGKQASNQRNQCALYSIGIKMLLIVKLRPNESAIFYNHYVRNDEQAARMPLKKVALWLVLGKTLN